MEVIWLHIMGKRINSTKRTNAAQGLDVVGEIKNGADILSPTFTFSAKYVEEHAYNLTQYNYLVWRTRAYYITNWLFIDGVYECSTEVDVLGTWREQIRSSEQYVARSTVKFDPSVVDNAYPKSADPYYIFEETSLNYAQTYEDGCYIIGCLSGGDGGAITYYQCGYNAYKTICSQIFNSDELYSGISAEEISQELYKAVVNPAQYIESIRWYPFQAVSGYPAVSFKIGMWDIPVTQAEGFANQMYVVTSPKVSFVKEHVLEQSPYAARIGMYANKQPFAIRRATIPPFGEFVLDSEIFTKPWKLRIYIDVDIFTGVGRMIIAHRDPNNTEIIIREEQTDFGVPVPLKSSTYDLSSKANLFGLEIPTVAIAAAGKMGGSLVGTIGNAFGANNGAVSTVQNVFDGIGDLATAASTRMELTGNVGTLLGFQHPVRFETFFFDFVGENTTGMGRPYCKMDTLSNHGGGCVLCPTFMLPLQEGMTKNELLVICEFFKNGVWIE